MHSFEDYLQTTLYSKLLHHGSEEAGEMSIRSDLERVEVKLKELLWKTILDDENASVILYGYPGSGKSLVVERVLHQLEEKCNGEIPILCVVRLSGVTERDKIDGFKSVARQLCAFMKVKFASHLSADQNIQFLKTALTKLHQANRSCVFVMDAFEKFVRDSEKQEVVYTLLDVLQRKDVRSCVIGMTSDFRVKVDFDKRVNSRFSHKSWTIPKCDDVLSVLASMLDVERASRFRKKAEKYRKSIQEALDNPMIQEYAKLDSRSFGPRDIRDVAILAVANARARSDKSFQLTTEDIRDAIEQCMKRYDPFPAKISQLAVPHLYMLVSCAQLDSRFTCKAAFAKYDCFRRTQNTSDVFEEPLMTEAFEDLFHENLIVRSKETKHSGILISALEMFSLNITKGEIQKGIRANPFASTILDAFFKSE